jgi:hypothetical protein
MVFVVCMCALGLAQEIGTRYLIITHDNFYNSIQPLAEWKHKKGIMTKVVRTSDIGTTAYAIKNYITTAYNTWTITPEYILFVGAPNYIPFGQVSGTYTDNYYTNMDGDIYNEILSGRLTVHSTTEADAVVAKILKYERTPDLTDSTWLVRACLIVNEDYDPGDTLYWDDIEYVADHLVSNNYTYVDTFSAQQGDNANSVIQAANNGRGFVLYRGSATNNWYWPFNVNPSSLTNGNELPIVVSATCFTLGTGSTPATAERWLLTGTSTTLRGAAGYFATTTGGYHLLHLRSAVTRGFFDAIFVDNVRTFGEASEAGRQRVYSMYPYTGGSAEYYGFTTVGDPEMNIWTAVPQSVEVVHPASITTDAESLKVEVSSNEMPFDSAQVCVVLDTVVYECGYTALNGSVVLYFDELVEGIMDITVTGKNVIPYESTITVLDAGVADNATTGTVHSVSLHVFPNPCKGKTDIKLNLSDAGPYELKIFNAVGQLVKTFRTTQYSPHAAVFSWCGDDDAGNRLPQGVYFCRINTEDTELSEEIILLR